MYFDKVRKYIISTSCCFCVGEKYKIVGNYTSDIFSPNIMLVSVTLLLILKKHFVDKGKNIIIFRNLSQCTFGIYLLHVWVIQIISRIRVKETNVLLGGRY